MSRIGRIQKQTDNRFLNLYELEAIHRDGSVSPYYVASRAKEIGDLKAVTQENKPDGVILYGVYGEQKDKVVLIRQYRYPLNGYVYEFPAGLVEPGEDFNEAAVREMKEETGLELNPIRVDRMYSEPRFTTVGMTDESCATVYGYVDGECSLKGLEESEELEIVLADKEEVRRILKEERVAIMCAYMLMHFLHSEDGEPFAFLEEQK